MADLLKALMARGFFTIARWNHLLLSPPLTITADEVRWGLDVLNDCLAVTDAVTTG
jgi:4-aminobutyrate aminotransferase-like enzyme